MKMTKNKIMNMISTRRDDNEYNMIMIMMLIMNITSTRWDHSLKNILSVIKIF